MIKIEICCEPSELEAHMRALNYWPVIEQLEGVEGFVAVSRRFEKQAGPKTTQTVEEAKAAWVAKERQASATAEKREAKAVELAENGTSAQKGALVTAGLAAAGRAAELEPAPDENSTRTEMADEEAVDHITDEVKAPPREHGKPKPGNKRRTAAEVAEDEAHDIREKARLAASTASEDDEMPPALQISTGEARIDPQDAADEAAETAATHPGKLTHDDVRAAHKRYADAFGMPAAIANVRTIIGAPVVDIPNTPEALQAAIDKIDAAINAGKPKADTLSTFIDEVTIDAGLLFGADTPVEPEPIVDPLEEFFGQLKSMPPRQEQQPAAVVRIKAYGKKFDGVDDDPARMPIAIGDIGRTLQAMFGPEVKTLGSVPRTAEAFGSVCTALEYLIQRNPFGRTVVK